MTLGVFFQTHSTRPVAELVLNTSAPHVDMTSMIGLVTFYFYSSYFMFISL